MKTVFEVVSNYNQRNETNRTPLRGFKVGDEVKYAPLAVELFKIELSGEVITIDNDFVIFEVGPKGSHNLRKIDELLLMPND